MGDMEKWRIAPMSSIPAMYEARDIKSYDSGDIIKALGDEVDSVKALLSTELDKLDEVRNLILGIIKHCTDRAEQADRALCGDDRTIGEHLAYVDVTRRLRCILEML